ncbi:MAG: DNA alkylation repair protein [Thermoanaerobaculia bacterium]
MGDLHPVAETDVIRARLAPLGTRERAEGEKRYLKSELEFLGVGVPAVRKTTRAWLESRPSLKRAELRALVEELWGRHVNELRRFAIELLTMRSDLLRAADMKLLERLLRDSHTWAYVDALAVHVAGALVERYRGLEATLDRWARDDDFWIRRSAMLALLLPLRDGGGDWDRFAGYADRMLAEKEFFIRKAIGWILRETSKKRPELVIGFVGERIDRIAGLTLREAVRHLAPAERDRLMAAYRSR